jgi:tetratricopeptide (TPR) repeat protein
MDNIETMIADGHIDEAMAALDSAISTLAVPDADEEQSKELAKLYFMRGKLHWRMGHRRDALNDYSYAVSLDPISPAATALAQARAIMEFHAPDLYNP